MCAINTEFYHKSCAKVSHGAYKVMIRIIALKFGLDKGILASEYRQINRYLTFKSVPNIFQAKLLLNAI